MKKLLKFAVCLALLVMVVALFTGCKVTGGGWFIDREENKCTFGLVAQGECLEFKGQFQFNDHNETKIHVEVMQMLQFGDDYAEFSGWTDEGKLVVVYVEDSGEVGPDKGDYIAIYYDGQIWDGELRGGNIKVHPYE